MKAVALAGILTALVAAGFVACSGSPFTTTAGDGGASDGGVEVATDDGPASVDGDDGGCAPSDAGWCTQPPESATTFCYDFDETTALPGKWDTQAVLGAGMLSVVSSLCPPSPPNALSAVMRPEGGSSIAVVSSSFMVAGKASIALDFRVRGEGLRFGGGGGYIGVAAIQMGMSGAIVSLVVVNANALAVLLSPVADAGAMMIGNTTAAPPIPNEWKRLRLVVSPTSVTASEDGTEFVNANASLPFTGNASVTIGGTAGNAQGEIDIDNVTVDVR